MIKITDQEFRNLVEFLKNKYGINLEQKRVLLEGRLTGYLEKNGFTNYADYIKAVQLDKTGKEITNLLNKVTTNHTYFMRESEHFHYFKDHVLPDLEQRVRDKDLRIWCAASSSGEEPYTLAMLLRDHFGGKIPKWDTKLLATDLSQKVLEQAKAGLYMEEAIKDVPSLWKKKYFAKAPANKNGDPMVQVTREIKNEVVYKIFNLMDPIVAKKPYQVVFCRNVMIYFDMQTKAALVNRIYDATCPGGYLFIGHTESLPKPSRYNYIMPSVYQKGF